MLSTPQVNKAILQEGNKEPKEQLLVCILHAGAGAREGP